MNDHTALLDTLLENVRDAVVLVDGERRLVRVNRAFQVLTGLSEQDLLTRTGENAAAAYDHLTRAMATSDGGRWHGVIRGSDGTDRRVEIQVAAVNGTTPFPEHYFGIVRPSAAEPIVEQSTRRFGHDTLTGLPNRDIFVDRVDQAVLQVNRSGASVALMMMGLDRFTLINDALGHAAGDRLLIEISRRLKNCIRETDTAVRLEGDRFALVMTIADMDDSVIVAEKVLAATKEPFAVDGEDVVVTFSIGIGIYPQDTNSASALVKNAENALHYAKVSGRNQYQFFAKDMNQKARSRLELEGRMRKALVNNEFTVFYQPKVRAGDDMIVGAEALVRWIDPDRGMVGPGEFIPIAEETGLIEQIGNLVLMQTCRENKAWQEKGLLPVKISVNVSARQFRNRGFVDTVTTALDRTGLGAAWLELEITESMLMHDVESVVVKMTELRELGVGLSIDDFGTGYSSLSYLGRFPITTLKIDRAFIMDVDTNPKTAEIARAIIGLSKGLNLEVVAEGCEIAEHVEFLQEQGCQTVQGFYYSRPVPSAEFEQMLRARILPSKKAKPVS